MLSLLFLLINVAFANTDGVTAEKIIVGSAIPLTGDNAHDGAHRKRAFTALENRVRAMGGINGRMLEFKFRDMQTDPKLAVGIVRDFTSKDKTLAAFNVVGTPAATSLVPIVERDQMPYIAPIAGGEFLTTPVKKFVFPFRPSFAQEADRLITHAVKVLGIKKIGYYGRDEASPGRSATVLAMDKHKLKPVAFAVHKREETDATPAAKMMKEAGAEAVIIFSITPMAIRFLKAAAEMNYKPIILGPSPITPGALLKEASAAGEGSIFAFGYPMETDESFPIVKSFREDMTKAGFKGPELSAYALETYVNGVIMIEAMRRAGADLNRKSLVKALETMNNWDAGGMSVNLNARDHQALNKVFLRKIENGKMVGVE